MMKHIKKLIAIALTVAIFSQMVSVYAASFTPSSSVLNNSDISDVTISTIADAIHSDPAATNIQISENTLTYIMNGTTNVRITETVNNGVRYFDIIEGEIHDKLSINAFKNIITLNGTPLSLSISQDISRIPNEAAPLTTWVYSGTRNINIVAEDAIRNLAVNTLLTLMLSAMGGIGVALSLAQLVWDAYQSSTSDTVYATRTTYFESNYWAYKYIDKYYSDSERTKLIETVTTEHWE